MLCKYILIELGVKNYRAEYAKGIQSNQVYTSMACALILCVVNSVKVELIE